MMQPIPAPGYTPTTGDRPPRKSWGDDVMVQLRNGWCARDPFPVATSVWVWTGSGGDIVAIKKCEG
jgi:hypothetical protein